MYNDDTTTLAIYTLNYKNNLSNKKAIDTTINIAKNNNSDIDFYKLLNLISRDMSFIVYDYETNIYSEKITIDYIDNNRNSLYYKGKVVEYGIKFYNYLLEFFLYGTPFKEIYLPLGMQLKPVLMYKEQDVDEYLKCLNIMLKIKYSYTESNYIKLEDMISSPKYKDLSIFIDKTVIFKNYVEDYLIENDYPYIYNVLNFEFKDSDKDVIDTYLKYRAKYLLENNKLLPLNFSNIKIDKI